MINEGDKKLPKKRYKGKYGQFDYTHTNIRNCYDCEGKGCYKCGNKGKKIEYYTQVWENNQWFQGYIEQHVATYDYEESGCFVSTAAAVHLGKNDKCKELEMLRFFRDNFMLDMYKEEVEIYYSIAPLIVTKIESLNPESEYRFIWDNCVSEVLKYIEKDEFELARNLSRTYMIKLYKKYLFDVDDSKFRKVLRNI